MFRLYNLFLLDLCLQKQIDRDFDARINYVSKLRTMLVDLLRKNSQLIVHNENDWDYSGIMTVDSERNLSALYETLLENKIITKYFSEPNLLRISLCYLNNSDDVYSICGVIDF